MSDCCGAPSAPWRVIDAGPSDARAPGLPAEESSSSLSGLLCPELELEGSLPSRLPGGATVASLLLSAAAAAIKPCPCSPWCTVSKVLVTLIVLRVR